MLITSLTNEKIKEIVKLKEKKYRDESNTFLVEGYHLVEEAYKHGVLKTLIRLENIELDYLVTTIEVTKDVMKKISDLDNIPNCIGICNMIEYKEDYSDTILVLNNVQDPGNLGTIIRSSVAFSIRTIVVDSNTVDIYNPKVIRATQGMIFNINVIKRDLNIFLKEIKELGYKVYSSDISSKKELKDIEKNEKRVIIMGNEGTGIDRSLLDLSDETIYIKMNNNCESLNVGVAASIILYELSR